MHRVGDSTFSSQGKPGYVSNRNPMSGELTVGTDRKEVIQRFRHGYINGLSEPQRVDFEKILDNIKSIEDPEKRVSELQAKIEELNIDPRNRLVTNYLNAELFHLMNSAGIQPKQYTVPGDGKTKQHL